MTIPIATAERTDVSDLPPKHVAIAEYIAANPERKMGEVAVHFRVSPAWLSTIKRSAAFRELLAAKQEILYGYVCETVAEKLTALSEIALDKLTDMVAVATEIDDVREVAAMALDRSGYAPKTAGVIGGMVQQNNFYSVDPALLEASRRRILERQGITIDQLPAPSRAEEVSAGGDRSLERHLADGAALSASADSPRSEG